MGRQSVPPRPICVSRWTAARVSSCRSFVRPALKEARARLAPALPRVCVFRRDRPEQCACQHLDVERVCTDRDDEFAELANSAFLEGLRFRFERFQFRIDIAGFAHVASP